MTEDAAAPLILCASDVRLGTKEDENACGKISLGIEPGTLTVLRGGEGSGKNALLRLLGLLDVPACGDLFLHGEPTGALDEAARTERRNRHFGFAFQNPFLLDAFSVVENVAMPLFKISGAGIAEAREHTDELLELAGLSACAQSGVASLSPLEQHKVSLARALANRPEILIAEEVDALLAGDELADFLATMTRMKTHFGLTVLASASGAEAVPDADRTVELENGKIVQDSHPVPADCGEARTKR